MPKQSPLTRGDIDPELEMSPGSNLTQDDNDDFDPGVLLGLNNIVPLLPNIPGYHVAWAAIPSDVTGGPAAAQWIKSLMLGYRPITPEEFTKYSIYGMSAGEIAQVRGKNNESMSCVRVMDVVAVKIPIERYGKITKYLEAQVLRTEADIRRRPASNTRNPQYGEIYLDQKPNMGSSVHQRDAFDKI